MTHERYRKKRLERKSRRGGNRHVRVSGMGVRLSGSSADSIRYPRIRSAKKFIKLADGFTCITFLYETFAISGYGCKKVVCIHREPETLLERHGEKLCWNSR